MTKIDLKALKILRDQMLVSFELCKKALEQSNNNITQAKKLLNEWGIQQAEKKANRTTKQGAIFSYIHHNGKIGSIVQLLCETDFVARNDQFQALGKELAMQIAFSAPSDEKALLCSNYLKDESKTVDNVIKEYILKIGENIKIGQYFRLEL
ncbi:hypothetical protein A3J15_01840 [Candidatus Roizmanbacteria bacterium RIFCSPLOWO2_02_FULL_38_10]|uniref:Elongation factor Ts n=1 Tax=Candidatus Roizmanbacteria bacterium RIFCSPLOWO2_02_FULL_38_10 TaxID=1802074 RepID=A0A1F7JKI5_9BACT|nr:MAG: hypothetical protein A3J15_01840 [Candidatus Roizmanbacteria bacterium RIFCSPLOWO2_02_FULL_38_10]